VGAPALQESCFGRAKRLDQARSRGTKGTHRLKPVTLDQALKAVLLILVLHLAGFDYRREEGSLRARTARMLAAVSVVLADTVSSNRTQ
jgi:hypothetical protein